MMTTKSEKPKLIFVYNADSGLKNTLIDSAHKMFSPKTYPCKLCDLTYHALGEKKAWKRYRKNAKAEMKFLHADEFQQLYKSKFRPAFELPVVLVEDQYELELLLSNKALDDINDLQTLINRIEGYLEKHST
ncbi:MAG: GTPase [Psychroflexus maritimus]